MDPVQPPPPDPNATSRIAWWRSLRTRLLFWSTFTSLMLLAALAAIFYLGVRTLMLDNARVQMGELATQASLALGATMESVQIDAAYLRIVTLQGSDPSRWRAALQATVLADEDIDGAMLIVEPGKLGADDPGWNWYVRLDDGGELVEKSVADLGYDWHALPWWTRTVGGDEAWWSEPYANAATGGRLFVTYNLPLRRERADGGHEVVGMVSLDVPLGRLRAVIGGAAVAGEVKPGLLSPGRLLADDPNPQVATQRTLDAVVAAGRSDLQPFLDAVRERRPFAFEHRVAGGSAVPVAGDGLQKTVQQGDHRYSIAQPVADTGWTIVLSAADDYLLTGLNRIIWIVLGIGLAGGVAGMFAMRRTTAMVAGPIEDLTDSARHFGDGEFDRPLRHVERRDEVGLMARVFDAARHSIKRQMREIADLGAARAKLESELQIAGDIQQAMLPRGDDFAAGGGHLQLAGVLEPAKAVGGDFYNFFSRDGEALWFVIGDVSDKGIPAALFMARAMTVLEVAARDGNDPGAALREAALHLVQNNDTCMFATVLCGAVRLRSGELVLASAAHEAPVLLRADGRREFIDVPTMAPLGIDVADAYPAWRGRLEPGDTLLGYSDGITEAFDRDDVGFGSERLLAALDPALAPEAQCRQLLAAVHAFVAGAAQSDDITALALRYGSGAEAGT